jgi:hypothetical protein
VFIMMRGELLQLDVDKETTIAKIPEGSVFGETVVLRNLEVGHPMPQAGQCQWV